MDNFWTQTLSNEEQVVQPIKQPTNRNENFIFVEEKLEELKQKWVVDNPNVEDVKLEYKKLKSAHGYCKTTRRFGQLKEYKIVLSEYLVKNGEKKDIEQTLLHEFAHALDHNGRGHGVSWKRIAKELGVKNPKSSSRANYKIDHKYTLYCSECGKQVGHKDRKTRSFMYMGNFKETKNIEGVIPDYILIFTKTRCCNGNVYVKQNY